MNIFLKANTPESPQPRSFVRILIIRNWPIPRVSSMERIPSSWSTLNRIPGFQKLKETHANGDNFLAARENPYVFRQRRSLPILGDPGGGQLVRERLGQKFLRTDERAPGMPLLTNQFHDSIECLSLIGHKITVLNRRPASIALLSWSSYTSEFTFKLDCFRLLGILVIHVQ